MSRIVLFFLCLVYIVSAIEHVCPGFGFVPVMDKCVDNCDPNNDQCPSATKCCYRPVNPCGFQCVQPKVKTLKQGQCPKSLTHKENPDWFLCDAHLCDVDTDCEGRQKCCSNTCGANICLDPLF